MKEDKELPRLSDNPVNQEDLPQVQSVDTEPEWALEPVGEPEEFGLAKVSTPLGF